MSKKAVWFSQDPRDQTWGQYDPSDTAKLEKSWQSNKAPVSLDFGGSTFTVDLKKMEQRNGSGGARKVRRDEVSATEATAAVAVSAKTTELFTRIAGAGNTTIGTDGFEELFKAVGIDASKWDSFLFMYAMNCKGCWSITLEEFQQGCAAQGISTPTPAAFAGAISKLKKTLQQRDAFLTFYTWCFRFCRASVTAQIIPVEEAVNFIPLLLGEAPQKRYPLQKLLDFITAKSKSLSADVWRNIGIFVMDVNPDLANAESVNSCWPTIIDDFLEAAQRK